MSRRLAFVGLLVLLALAASSPRVEAAQGKSFMSNIGATMSKVASKMGDIGTFFNKPRKQFTSAARKISPSNVRCVLCQYMVQRIHAEMLINGIGGGVPFGQVGSRPLIGVEGNGPFANVPDAFTPPPAVRPGENSAAAGSENAAPAPAADGAAPVPTMFLEVEAATEARRVGFVANLRDPFAQSDATKNWKAFWAGPGQWKTGRARTLDMLVFRPTQRRFATLYDGPLRAARRAQERFENNQMYAIVYRVLESMCTQKMPKPFYPYCGAVMQNYQAIVNGLKWKDRPDAICMEMDMCDINSYVQQGAHATYRDY